VWTAVWLAAVAVLLWLVFPRSYQWHWEAFWNYRTLFFKGWLLMLSISAVAMLVSIMGGFLLMLGGRVPLEPVRVACRAYVTFMRGSPLLVILLLGYYGVAAPLRLGDALYAGTLLLGMFEAAYLAEIFRAALESINRGQREAAKAVGFSPWQMYRYVLIPQSIRRALPGATGELVSLVKSSSLLSVLGIEEVTQITRMMNARSYTALEGFIPLALAYLVITLPLSYIAAKLEKRFAYDA
jgi:polar amino acid transport system permease protein